jgi:hypothetical protein
MSILVGIVAVSAAASTPNWSLCRVVWAATSLGNESWQRQLQNRRKKSGRRWFLQQVSLNIDRSLLGKTGQTNQVIQWTDDSELPEIRQDWVKVDVSRQQGSSRDMRAKLSLLTFYLAIQCHMLSVIKLMSSQHKELKVGKWENVAK